MTKERLIISADCICDLPTEIIERFGINIFSYNLFTEHGEFIIDKEFTRLNLFDFVRQSHQLPSVCVPSALDYENRFRKLLADDCRIVHISTSSQYFEAAQNAEEARARIAGSDPQGERLKVLDCATIGCGYALIVYDTAKFAMERGDFALTAGYAEKIIGQSYTSFVLESADYAVLRSRNRPATGKAARAFNMGYCAEFNPGHRGAPIVSSFRGVPKAFFRNHIKNKLWQNNYFVDLGAVCLTINSADAELSESVTAEIKSVKSFQDVLVCPSSAATAWDAGNGIIGVSFISGE